MAKPIRLGLIGCGGIVQLVHARAYLSLPNVVEVVALADVLEENLQQVGQTFDVPSDQRYADYRERWVVRRHGVSLTHMTRMR